MRQAIPIKDVKEILYAVACGIPHDKEEADPRSGVSWGGGFYFVDFEKEERDD